MLRGTQGSLSSQLWLSLLYPSSRQRDLILASEAIWICNLAEQSAMYSAPAVLRETLDYFLLNHEIIADPRV